MLLRRRCRAARAAVGAKRVHRTLCGWLAVERPTVLEVGYLRLDPATKQVWRGTAEIELTAKEFALLQAFMERPGEVLSRAYLLERAWDMGYDNRSNVIAVYVNYLRDKIDRPFGADSIATVRGAGYRLRKDDGR
jgi:two-component system, OmpR family, response regulator